jgi:hypothetical protein
VEVVVEDLIEVVEEEQEVYFLVHSHLLYKLIP